MVRSRKKKVAGKGSSQTLLGDYKPWLTSRSCGGFPGIGRTFASAPLPLPVDRSHRSVHFSPPVQVCRQTPAPLARFSAPSLSRSFDSNRCPAEPGDACPSALPVSTRLPSSLLERTASRANTSRHSAPPATAGVGLGTFRRPERDRAWLPPDPANAGRKGGAPYGVNHLRDHRYDRHRPDDHGDGPR